MARLNAVSWLFFSPRRHPRISKTPACIYFSDTCTFERYRPLPDPSRGQEAKGIGHVPWLLGQVDGKRPTRSLGSGMARGCGTGHRRRLYDKVDRRADK
jgi:hypothetical protein